MNTEIAVYAVPLAMTIAVYAWSRQRQAHRDRRLLERSLEEGTTDPSSLHPVIDPGRCMGCGACQKACPEGNVLGIVQGRAQLVAPANCIGHGACRMACPFDAIELVFGTEKRGVDIPHVTDTFETNVDGLYIAGELGGMGLVANAVEQGCQAAGSIARKLGKTTPRQDDVFDVVIVGAGPAGIAGSLMCSKMGLRSITLEQDSLGGSVSHFPRHKVVMTRPVTLPIYGPVKVRRIEKEELIALWTDVFRQTDVEPVFECRVASVEKQDGEFVTSADDGRSWRSRSVLLALGRRGTPRKLEVPGEGLAKVMYKLVDPAQYRDSRIVVVGGGDSAVEAALALAEQPGNEVTLSYRGAAISRAKVENRQKFQQAVAAGRVRAIFESNVTAIEEDRVTLLTTDGTEVIDNDWVIVSVGGVLPTAFLRNAGIEVNTLRGESSKRRG